MGFKARLITLAHLILSFVSAIIITVGFASNNWIEASFIKGGHGVVYTSGIFLGCLNFRNLTGHCSKKIVYGARGTFNLDLGEAPDIFIERLVKLATNMYLLQPIDIHAFSYDEEFFDEGKLTFTNIFTFSGGRDSDSIFCSRYLISLGLILVVASSMINFFLSCVYSVNTTKVFVGIYVLGSFTITMGACIIFIPYKIDSTHPNPDMAISMGFGMILIVIGVIAIQILTMLLSVTLITVEKAKIKDIVKTATLVNKATMMTMGHQTGTLCRGTPRFDSEDIQLGTNFGTNQLLPGQILDTKNGGDGNQRLGTNFSKDEPCPYS